MSSGSDQKKGLLGLLGRLLTIALGTDRVGSPSHSQAPGPIDQTDPWQDTSPEEFERALRDVTRRVDRLRRLTIDSPAQANRLLESISVLSGYLISLSEKVRDLYEETGLSSSPDLDIIVLRHFDPRDPDADDDDEHDSLEGEGMGGMLN